MTKVSNNLYVSGRALFLKGLHGPVERDGEESKPFLFGNPYIVYFPVGKINEADTGLNTLYNKNL